MMNRRTLLAGLAPAALALPAAGQAYTITELEPFPAPDTQSGAFAIDDHGWVAGHANHALLEYPHAVVWAGNVRLDLSGEGVSGAWARGVVDGAAVGFSDSFGLNAFEWSAGERTPLATDSSCCSDAYDRNLRGWIVGNAAFGPQSIPRAALWRDGELVDMGTLGGFSSYAHAVNEAGEIVGMAFDTDGELRPFRWEAGVMVDLGTLGGPRGQAQDVNEAGQIVGYADDARGFSTAFLHEDGAMTNLGTLPGGLFSYAHAINDAGVIVGASYSGSAQGLRSTIWENGAPVDLNDLVPQNTGWVLRQAHDVNADGEIVGSGTLGFLGRGFKLTPVGLQRLVLAPPVPGIAGQPNAVTATWPVPGDPVEIWASRSPFAGGKAGWPLGGPPAERPVLVGTAITGADGSATVSLALPPATGGESIWIQAVRPGTGVESRVVRFVVR